MAATARHSTKPAMTKIWIFSFLFLSCLWGIQLTRRSLLTKLRWFIFGALAGLAALLTYYTALQYFTWLTGGALARFLLPPHQSISYFLFYSYTEFWANYLIAGALGALGFFAIKLYNKKHQEMLFYREEPLLCFLAFLLVGHPLWVIYSTLLLIALLCGTFYSRFVRKTNERVSFYYLWIPVALLTLALSSVLEKTDFVIFLSM